MDGIIVIAAIILNPRAEKRRREGGIMLTETLTETTETNIHILNSALVTYNSPSHSYLSRTPPEGAP